MRGRKDSHKSEFGLRQRKQDYESLRRTPVLKNSKIFQKFYKKTDSFLARPIAGFSSKNKEKVEKLYLYRMMVILKFKYKGYQFIKGTNFNFRIIKMWN